MQVEQHTYSSQYAYAERVLTTTTGRENHDNAVLLVRIPARDSSPRLACVPRV
jgi:hypothetical protein